MKILLINKNPPTCHSIYHSFGFYVSKNKKPLKKRGFKGGPTWARTRDQLIMSQLL